MTPHHGQEPYPPELHEHGPPSGPPSGPLSDARPPRAEGRGPLAWMTKSSVAANLLMFALLFGGFIFMTRIKQEVFPEFDLDVVHVSIAYPGASPEEVEKAITKAVEENVRGIDGVKRVTSTSSEGLASIQVELLLDTDPSQALSDVKAAVDRITSFPQDAERPITSIVQFRSEVLSLVLYGDASEKALRALADEVRDELLQDPRMTTVELAAVRPLEISVEIPREGLRADGLTLEQVAQSIRAANVELPAGGTKTGSGEILLRTAERRDYGQEFEQIVVLSRPDGTQVRLGDIAVVDDSFRDTDQEALFNGKPAAMVRVFRVGNQTPHHRLGGGARIHRRPPAEPAAGRRHGRVVRSLRGVPAAHRSPHEQRLHGPGVGALVPRPVLGDPPGLLGDARHPHLVFGRVSLFSHLGCLHQHDLAVRVHVTLGIVVDDAIVVGEAVYKRRTDGLPLLQAAIAGTRDVAVPVVFSVLTTLVGFSPLMFVPGVMGKFFRNIPIVVIVVLAISLVESLLVLPAHLGHTNPIAAGVRRLLRRVFGERLGPFGWIFRAQQRFSDAYERFITLRFAPILETVIHNRYITIACGVALLVGSFGFAAGGHIDFTFMPKIESDVVIGQLKMPYGTPAEITRQHMDRMIAAAKETMAEHGGEEANSRGIFAQVGAAAFGGMGRGVATSTGGHMAEVAVFMKPPDERKMPARELARIWRDKIGDIPGADTLKFVFTTGASSQAPISLQLSHRDVATLEAAAADLAAQLRNFTGVKDVDDGVEMGKRQLDFALTPEARSLGITEVELARQVRNAFFGAEASRQQRGRDEVRVYVRLPEIERTSLHDLDELILRTPQGGEIPLKMAAEVESGRAYTSINREDGRRVVTVEADVEEGKANANKVMAELQASVIPDLLQRYPGLSFEMGGQQQQAESLAALRVGFLLALIAMFALMAIPLKSYAQPLIIMTAIPFGFVGALGGHLLLGFDLSILSMMGLVALAGVAVNDSLVLISAINDFRAEGMGVREAVVAAGVRRFRPIMLTSLTTFLGLAPMIFETSVQARFLIPMAISLGFGVLFATFITLLLVPSIYLVLEDVTSLFRPAPRGSFPRDASVGRAAAE